MSFQKNNGEDNADFDPDRFAELLEKLADNSDLVAQDPKHLENMHLNLDIAYELMRSVRELKSKNFKKTYTEQQLIQHFCNITKFKKLNDESPGLFICAINELLDSGEPKKLVDLIDKGNGNGEKTALLMKKYASDWSDEFKTKVTEVRNNLKAEMPAPKVEEKKKETEKEKEKSEVPTQSHASQQYREKVLREQERARELLEKFRQDKLSKKQ